MATHTRMFAFVLATAPLLAIGVLIGAFVPTADVGVGTGMLLYFPMLFFAAHITDHPDADLSVAALTEQTGMTHRSFQRLFTREVGTSPGRYVERVRIDAARRMLEQGDDGIARVAGRCGFTTVETFHQSFRRVIGVTPTEYGNRFRTPVR